MPQNLELVYAQDIQQWRDWLAVNHQTSPGVWLVYYKVKSGKPSIRYPDAVKQALCFGWIDSKVNTIDSESYKQVFTPRRPKSVWSKLNKQYIEELVAAGLIINAAGWAKIQTAQADGSWTSLDAVEALVVPDDLQRALTADPQADRYWQSLRPGKRKVFLQ